MELFVSFSEIMHFFKKTRVRFLIVVLVFGIVAGLLSLKFFSHVYTASTTFSVTCGVPSGADSDYHLQYTNILYSRVQSSVAMASGTELADQTAAAVGVDKDAITKITADQLNSAPVVKLTLETTDAAHAAQLTDTAAKLLTQDLIHDFPNPKLSASIVDHAVPQNARSRKSGAVKGGILGMVLGFILYICYGLIAVIGDKTARNSRYAEEALHTNLLAEIPDGEAGDSYRNLRAAAVHQAAGGKSFLVTEVCEKNGGEEVAAGFASALARTGKTVLLIDANLRQPGLAARFGVTSQKSLCEVLSASCPVSDAAAAVPDRKGLFLLPASAGDKSNPADVVAGDSFANLLEVVSKHYDYVVVSAPAESRYPEAENMAHLFESVVVSIRYGSTPFELLGETFHRLTGAGGKIIGFVTTGI